VEIAIRWVADFQRESIIKVGYFKITVILMLNFASSNVVFTCQNHSPTSISSDYIYHKNDKGKPPKKDLP
jgi:hypothetical protein